MKLYIMKIYLSYLVHIGYNLVKYTLNMMLIDLLKYIGYDDDDRIDGIYYIITKICYSLQYKRQDKAKNAGKKKYWNWNCL